MSQLRKYEIRHNILSFLYKHKYQVFTVKKLFYVCGIPKESFNIYKMLLKEFADNEFLFLDEDSIKWNCEFFLAKCNVFGKRYYAYCDKEKYRITLKDDVKPLDGDVVVAKIKDRSMLEADIVEISARTDKYILGTLISKNGVSFVIPDDRNRYLFDIYISGNQNVNSLNNSRVEIQINRYETKRNPCGTITRCIRNAVDDNEENEKAVLAKHGITAKFDEDVLSEASKIKDKISNGNYPSPKNFTNRILVNDRDVFYINDCGTSDLAFSLKYHEEGYELDIYTPDVAEIVQEGCKIDKAAYNKCFEIRTANKKVPIFPNELLENRILFKQGKKRLAVGCRMLLDVSTEIKKFEFFEAIIQPEYVIERAELNRYKKKPTDEFELANAKIMDAIVILMKIVASDRFLSEMSLSDAIDYYARSTFDRQACNIMTIDDIPIMYRSSDPINHADAARFTRQCRNIKLSEEDVDRMFFDPKVIFDVLDNVLNANVRKAFRINFESIVPIEEFCDVIKPNRRRGYLDCRVASPSKSHPDLYNQRILKRFIKKTIFNENVFDVIRTTIERDTERYNVAEYHSRQAIAECECAHNAKILKNKASVSAVAYNITPVGVYVVCDDGIKGLLKFEDYAISDQIMRYTDADGSDKEIRIGDTVEVKFHWLDIKNKRVVFQLANAPSDS